MTTHDWNAQQSAALTAVGAWLADPTAPQVFRLFGYAGTGKTTLARHLAAQQSRPVLFAAYTGKAASVLRAAGCEGATTLHSLLYQVESPSREKLYTLQARLEGLDPKSQDALELRADIAQEQARLRRPKFSLNEGSPVRGAGLLVLDEVSMVDKRLAADALSFGTKILVLGDPAQLPPINGAGYFTAAAPDAMLTEIHRQAKDNPIIAWATMARNGVTIPHGHAGGTCRKVAKGKIDGAWLANEAGQILTGKNATRQSLNKQVRRALGKRDLYPEDGDTLVCLKNNHKLGILNGVICTAHGDASYDAEIPDAIGLNVRYEGRLIPDLLVDASPFSGEEPNVFYEEGYQAFDFGYAITVHKAQGSQWPTVTLYDDGFGKRDPVDRNRWLYTAITRAQARLHIIAG